MLTGSDVNKALTVTCNIQMDLSLLGEINTTPGCASGQINRTITKAPFHPGRRFCCSAVDVLFHKVGGHFIQLHHRIFRALHHLAHIAAHLALALGSHHGTGSPKDCTGGHAHHMPAAEFSRCFILNFSFQPVMTGLAVLLFPQKNLVYAFFMQQFVVYCSMMLFVSRCARLFSKEVFLFAKTR